MLGNQLHFSPFHPSIIPFFCLFKLCGLCVLCGDIFCFAPSAAAERAREKGFWMKFIGLASQGFLNLERRSP